MVGRPSGAVTTDPEPPATVCRSCRAGSPEPLLDLGPQPLGDALLHEGDLAVQEPTYPLGLAICTSCWLLQLHPFDSAPDASEAHGHGSAYSTTASTHERRWADELVSQLGLTTRSKVVELGSGEGGFLRHFADRGIQVLGVEANPSAAAAARAAGVPTHRATFDRHVAQGLAQEGWSADLVLANHALPHVDDLDVFLAGVRTLLAPGGRFCTEFVHALQMVEQAQFDLVCHAHHYYLSLTALLPVLVRHGLAVTDAKEVPLHGGSLRVLAGAAAPEQLATGVDAIRTREQAGGLTRVETYRTLAGRARQVRSALVRLLREARRRQRSVVAYGAPTRGNTLLNYCAVTPELVAFTVDRSPRKQGLHLPGSRLPIRAPASVEQARPDYVLILPWTLADEIMGQLEAVRSWGGRFVLPLPTPRVVP